MCSIDQNGCQKLHPSAPHPEPSALISSLTSDIITYHRTFIVCYIMFYYNTVYSSRFVNPIYNNVITCRMFLYITLCYTRL